MYLLSALTLKKRPCTTATVPKVSHFQGHQLILSSKVIDLKAVSDAVRGEGHADLAQRKAGRRRCRIIDSDFFGLSLLY
jgi:hypothetical protein